MKNENRKGFTLVELLAVIAIIAILGITAVAAYNGITQRTKEKAYEAKIKQIENAAAKWASENNVNYKTEISVNKLIVQGYLQADSVSDEGKALISNPVDNSNMVCYVIDLSRKEGEYEAVVSKTKQNCSLAEQALYDEKIKVAAYTDTNKKVEFNDNYLTWTNRDISLIVSSEDFDSSAVSISYDFEGNTVTKNVSGLERSADQYQADDSKYYNVFNISAEIILNSNVVITYTLNDGSIYSRIVNVRIDKECATFIASSTNDWISVEKPLTVFIDDGEGSGVKGFYISKDIANKGDIILTSYKEDVDIKEVGTYYIWTEDMAGNISLAEDSKIIVNNIDTSEPTCEISFIGTLGQHGWYLTDVIPRATTSEAGISGLYFGISKTNTPVYPEYVSGGFVGTVDATLQNQTEKAGVNYYCFVKSLAGREGTNTKTAKVDKTRPTLKVEPTTNDENTIEKNVKISIADALSGLNADNKIYYAWSLDNVNPPTTWEYIEAKATDESNAAKAVSMTGKEKVGEYYLWIKGATITDYAGNSSDEENKVYGPYVYSATVTYDGNGNTSGSTASTICPYNKPCTLATNGFKKTGYTYSGWFTAKVGGTKYGTTHTFLDNTVVYAQWTPITYTIKFDGNGSTGGSTTSVTCTYDKECTLTNNGFSKTGYTFTGWNTKKDGTGTSYTNAQGVSNLTSTNGETITLYAQWKANTYTIKFDGNGSTSGSTTSVTCTYDSSCTLTKNGFAKTGYTFAGWAKSASGSVEYSNGKSVKNLTSINGDTVTLYAKWTPITYTIKFDGNGSTGGSTGEIACTYDKECTLTKNGFTKTGYTFAGWAKSASGSIEYSNGASVKNLSSKSGGIVTLYAKWTPITYTIKFDGNGSTGGSTTSVTCTYDSSCTLTKNGFTKTGYTFAGWNTLSTGKGTSYNNSASVKNLSSKSGDTVTLYAKWTANTYTIKFDGNGSTSGSTDSKTCTYDKDCALPSNGFKKTGYTFAGWNTLANGKGTSYTNGASVKNLSNASGGTATLYAQWTANTYTISYDSYVGTVATKPTTGTYGTQLTISNPTKNIVVSFNGNSQGATISSTSSITKAYTFNGWTSSSGDGLESTALYGSSSATSAWSGSSTKYSYFKNLRSTSGTVKMTSNWTAPTITLPSVTKTGYTCVWNSSSDGKGSLTVASGKTYTPTTAETRTFYAYCTAISYKISYSYGYGSAGTNAPTSGTYGSNVSISKPTKSVVLTFDRNSQGATISSTANVSGTSTFSGWTSSSSDGLASTALAGGSSWSGTATKATTFKNLSYTSGATVKLTATWDNPELTLPTIKKTGYTCSWNTSADGTGTKKASGATYTATRTRTWYAYCTPKTYTIAYDSHVGTVATKPTSGTYDSDVTISNPTKTLTITFDMGDTGIAQKSAVSGNYTFNGWTSSSDDGLNTSTAKTGSSSATSAWSGSKTKNTHFKNLRSTSGTVTMTSNWTAPSVKLPTLKKTGYTCTWNWIKSNGTTKSYASGGTYTASTATSRTLVAKCTVNCSEDNPTGCKVYYTCRQGNTFMYQSASSSAQAVTVASGTPLYKISESGNWTYFYTESLSSTNPWYVDVKGGQNYGWIYNACLTDQSADYCEFVQCPDL